MAQSELAIQVKNLKKSYGNLKVLKGINIEVKRGGIFALLGPNGAGKTTTIKILSTLLLPESGRASVNGFDVVGQAEQVRASIGLTGQYAAVDEYLTGAENLQLMGRLYRLSKADTARRAEQLLEQFDLVEAGKRPVRTYSGGMKRRIDLAMSLIASPPIVFLDEPTTGLDPRSRLVMWNMIRQMAADGITILLTTQYMDEADHLADQLAVIDDGKVIAEGTAAQLKAKVGSDRFQIDLKKKSDLVPAAKIIGGKDQRVEEERAIISVSAKGGVSELRRILQDLEKAKIGLEGVSMHSPSLDDVFITLTGHSADNQTSEKRGKW